MTERRPLAQLLVDSVRHAADPGDAGPLDPRLAHVSAGDVLAAGSHHRITPAVAREVGRHSDPPSEWLEPLKMARRVSLLRHLRALTDLQLVQDALDTAGITWVAVKGPVMADHYWPETTLREYYDLDVIIDRVSLPDALAALEQIGCRYVDRNWPLMRRLMRAEIAMTAPLGTTLDLHWHVSVPRSLRRAFDIDIAGMLRRRQRIALRSGHVTWTFDPIDTVMHLAFHAAHSGGERLMWSGDVWYAGSRLEMADWRRLNSRVRAARAEVPVALVVDRAIGLIGPLSALDPEVLAPAEQLWGRIARARERRFPPPSLPGDPHLGGRLFSSARRSFPTSLAHAMSSSWTVRELERKGRNSSPTESQALSQEVPDPSARAQYIWRASQHPTP